MKPSLKTRRDKSVCVNIFLEHPLTNLYWHYIKVDSTSCYWSYADFYTLITYILIILFFLCEQQILFNATKF